MRSGRFVFPLLLLAILGCRERQPASVRIDPALAALAPLDTAVLAGSRLEAVRATPVYKKWVAQKQSPELDRFARETGFDPRSDISELLVASNGKETLFAARGRFSSAELERKLSQPGARKMTHKGYTLAGTEEAAVVFLNSSTAAAGRAAELRSMIDRRAANGGGVPARMLEKVKSISAENQIWAVALGTGPWVERVVPGEGNLANIRRVLASVESSTVGIDLRSGLKMTANGLCRTEEEARLIHDFLRGLVGMGRLSTPDGEPELLGFYDGIQVTRQQNSVTLRAEVPPEALDKFLERFEPRGRRPSLF